MAPVSLSEFTVPPQTPKAVAYSVVVPAGMTKLGVVPAPGPPGEFGPAAGQNWLGVPVQAGSRVGRQQGADATHPLLTLPVKEVSYATGPQGEPYLWRV